MPFIYLQEKESKTSLQPFSLLRSVSEIRMGIFTFEERWAKMGYGIISEKDVDTLEAKGEVVHKLPASALPLNTTRFSPDGFLPFENDLKLKWLEKPWQVVEWNAKAIHSDFGLAVADRKSATIPASVNITGTNELFIEEGARLEHCYINTSEGPVYISRNVFIMDGAMLRGPLFIGEGTVIKMGASIYGGTYGSFCILGGEIKNAIFMSYSNKAHHGYIGDSWIGEWCNLGAGTTCSNVKNTGGKVKIWDIHKNQFEYANNKSGLFMGDFSRSAINTSFNTGTVAGLCTNIFNGQQLTPKFIPDFSWGADSREKYDFEKAINDIDTWMKFKNRSIDENTINKLRIIYQTTK